MSAMEAVQIVPASAAPELPAYPVDLDQEDIEQLIPHRGDIFFARRMRLLGADRYLGFITWEPTSMGIAGHFPTMPIVPAVYLIEAAAQVAGAGMMASAADLGDGADERIGVLAGVRRCAFSKPTLPGQEVTFDITVKQGSGGFVFANGIAKVEGCQVASFDLIVAFAEKRQVFPQR